MKKMATGEIEGYIPPMDQTNSLGLLSDVQTVDELGLTPTQRAALLQSIARGEEQYLAGEAIPGDEVLAWVRSWGTENELPPPQH